MLHPRPFAILLLAASMPGFLAPPAAAASPPAANPAQGEIGVTIGPATKLPLPRYVSLKTDRVNLREGPSKDHRTLWVFQRAGLPVEIIAEYETWRRIRDSEGTEGWVLHSLLSGRRTAVVLNRGGDKGAPVPLYDRADATSGVVAQLQAGVIASVKTCDKTWCRLVVALPQKRGDVDGYMRQDRLWGVYPDEKVE
ncbi:MULTISPECIES: SH3 domain-containing protein [Methylobacterium]|uniref:SH3 domain-containing protein n=1 Tax=Methylobacterium TaxID=407 RepID=UPI0013ECC7F3|nr:SH3 domain-containing protein [Methylobacterium sp. DB0501]NGM36390.1 SH3 domain-containing protein [Methylobacterium sp. DB0501]